MNPGFVYHKGQICNAGILCGLPGQPSDRSLLDFTSAVIDGQGCPIYTFAGNPSGDNTTSDNYVTRQTSDCFNAPAGFTGSQAGGVQVSSKGKSSIKRKTAARCTTAKPKHRSKKSKRRGHTRAHTAVTCKAAKKHSTKHHKAKHKKH